MHRSTRNQTNKIICIYKYTKLFWKPLCKISTSMIPSWSIAKVSCEAWRLCFNQHINQQVEALWCDVLWGPKNKTWHQHQVVSLWVCRWSVLAHCVPEWRTDFCVLFSSSGIDHRKTVQAASSNWPDLTCSTPHTAYQMHNLNLVVYLNRPVSQLPLPVDAWCPASVLHLLFKPLFHPSFYLQAPG